MHFSAKAKKAIAKFEEDGFGALPICMAKTQYSFSDNQNLLGAPRGFELNITDCKISAGAGFVIAMAGDIMRMPGLPKKPAALNMDVLSDGSVVGLF